VRSSCIRRSPPETCASWDLGRRPIPAARATSSRPVAVPATVFIPIGVSIWPVESGGFGVDFTYYGATGYAHAEATDRILNSHSLRTRFIQEIDGAWTVRFGPMEREPMREVLDRFAR
jgi:hypothetical protein